MTSALMRRFDPWLSSVIISNVHTATVCCSGNVTDDDDDEDEGAELLETRREVLLVTSFITFNTSFRPTLRTAAEWRLDGLSQPDNHTDRHQTYVYITSQHTDIIHIFYVPDIRHIHTMSYILHNKHTHRQTDRYHTYILRSSLLCMFLVSF